MKIVITEEQYNKLIEGYVNFPIDDDIALEVWEDKDKIELSTIVIPKRLIYLTPDTSFGGTSINRLKRFYKRFGFIENKGSNKDYEINDTMYRVKNEI